jgi:hypothetical protein
VFVVIYGNRASVRFEDVHALLEEFVPGIENLPLLVARIRPVLTDQQDGIDGEFIAPASQRFCNGWISAGNVRDDKCGASSAAKSSAP